MGFTKEKTNTNYWKIADFAEQVGQFKNTVDNWFKKLEERNIHYVQRVGKEKVYDEMDLKIAKHIKKLRAQGWKPDGIYNAMEDGETGLEFRKGEYATTEEKKDKDDKEDTFTTLEIRQQIEATIKEQLVPFFGNMTEEVRKIAREEVNKQRQLLIEESEENQRQKRIDDLLIQRRVEDRLRNEAIMMWEKQPEEERFMRIGLFRKKLENINAKNRYIEHYISTRYEEELKKTFE